METAQPPTGSASRGYPWEKRPEQPDATSQNGGDARTADVADSEQSSRGSLLP